MAAPRSVTFDAHHFTRHARACRGQPHRRLNRSKHFWDKRKVLNAGSVVSAVAIPRTMNDGEHRNLVRWLVHHIDNSFAEATAQPLLEFVERQLRGIFVGTPS